MGGWFCSAPGEAFPARIAVDPAGPVYVGGRRNPSVGSPEIAIWRFDSSANTPAWTWSSPSPNGGFVQHGGITLDAGGNVFMSAIGMPYCGPAVPNSTGNAGAIRAHGSDGVSVNNISLIASDLPVGSFALFLTTMNQGSVPLLGGGQGTLCPSYS